jgi:hypothetical protein
VPPLFTAANTQRRTNDHACSPQIIHKLPPQNLVHKKRSISAMPNGAHDVDMALGRPPRSTVSDIAPAEAVHDFAHIDALSSLFIASITKITSLCVAFSVAHVETALFRHLRLCHTYAAVSGRFPTIITPKLMRLSVHVMKKAHFASNAFALAKHCSIFSICAGALSVDSKMEAPAHEYTNLVAVVLSHKREVIRILRQRLDLGALRPGRGLQ